MYIFFDVYNIEVYEAWGESISTGTMAGFVFCEANSESMWGWIQNQHPAINQPWTWIANSKITIFNS